MNANLHSVGGWLFFNEGNLNKAEKELETAVGLNNQNSIHFQSFRANL